MTISNSMKFKKAYKIAKLVKSPSCNYKAVFAFILKMINAEGLEFTYKALNIKPYMTIDLKGFFTFEEGYNFIIFSGLADREWLDEVCNNNHGKIIHSLDIAVNMLTGLEGMDKLPCDLSAWI